VFASRVGVEGLQSHINANLPISGLMIYLAVHFDGKLDVVPIRPFDQPDSFDLPNREGGKGACILPLGIRTNQAERANVHPIREGELGAIRFQLPARILVFDRAVIVLKLRIAFFARFLLAAVFVEAGNREPGAISTRLAGLLVEAGRKRGFFRQLQSSRLAGRYRLRRAHPSIYADICCE
jgi:hypothetical protein